MLKVLILFPLIILVVMALHSVISKQQVITGFLGGVGWGAPKSHQNEVWRTYICCADDIGLEITLSNLLLSLVLRGENR